MKYPAGKEKLIFFKKQQQGNLSIQLGLTLSVFFCNVSEMKRSARK